MTDSKKGLVTEKTSEVVNKSKCDILGVNDASYSRKKILYQLELAHEKTRNLDSKSTIVAANQSRGRLQH